MPEHDFRMDAVRVLPRHVICFLGPENWIESAARLVQRFGNGFSVDYEFSQDQPDDRMQEAFAACYDRVAPTMLSKDWESISAHRSVVYVLSAPLPKHQAVQASASALALTAQILRSGGMAAKSESAGLAHGRIIG